MSRVHSFESRSNRIALDVSWASRLIRQRDAASIAINSDLQFWLDNFVSDLEVDVIHVTIRAAGEGRTECRYANGSRSNWNRAAAEVLGPRRYIGRRYRRCSERCV